MAARSERSNVLLLGTAFHLLFFSFQTSVFIQQTVVNSLRAQPERHFTGNGYVSLCLTYAVFALANWLAPSVIAHTGTRNGMFLGALTYALYSASFIEPTTSLFYLAAGLIGLGAGLLWTAQGGFLAQVSSEQTAGQNAAIFWSMLQSSLLLGNLFVYFAFDTEAALSDRTRHLVYGVLTLVGTLGTLLLLLLRDKPVDQSANQFGAEHSLASAPGAWGQFVGALKLAKTSNMLLLATAFLFTGQLLSFFTGVYGTAIGATSQFGPNAKRFIGLAGIFIGLGEILGGAVFGLLGDRVNKRLGRDTIFVLGYLVTLSALALAFINLPPDSSLASEALAPAIIEPRIWIAMLGSVLIGLGDACFNTQIYSLLISVYQANSVGAFALFKFVQSAGSAAAFLYSTQLNLYHQLLILALISSLATICFCLVEWRGRRAQMRLQNPIDKTESQQDIIANDSLAQGRTSTNSAPSSRASSTSLASSVTLSTASTGSRQAGQPKADLNHTPAVHVEIRARSPLQYIKNVLRTGPDRERGDVVAAEAKLGQFKSHQEP